MLTFMCRAAIVTLCDALQSAFVNTDQLRLFKSSFVPTPTSTLADFVANEVAFTGYAAGTLSATPWNVGLDADNQVIMQYNGSLAFTQSGTGATDVAGGWFINDTLATAIKAHGTFDAPFQFNKTGNEARVQPSVQFPLNSDATVGTIVGP